MVSIRKPKTKPDPVDALHPPRKPRRGNQPLEVDPETIDLIINTYSETTQSLADIIETVRKHDMLAPSLTSFRRLVLADPEIGARLARARTMRADFFIEDAIKVADDRSTDLIVEDGQIKPNYDIVQRARLKVDARLKIATLLNPAYSNRPPPAGGKHGEGGSVDQDLATMSDADLATALESAASDLGVVLIPAAPEDQIAELRRLAAEHGFDLVPHRGRRGG